jgi:hypothetical protein
VTGWKAALIGPARSPTGYRDAVVLMAGRLVPIVVRQRHRDGNLRADAAVEISRGVQAQAININRERRRLIPDVAIGPDWLRTAATQRNIPLSAGLAQDLVGQLRTITQSEKAAFRGALDPAVAELLPDDEGLTRFYSWMRIEVAQLLQHIATGKLPCAVEELRQRHIDRAAALDVVKAMPCGFDAGHDEARSLVVETLAPIMKLLVHQPGDMWTCSSELRSGSWATMSNSTVASSWPSSSGLPSIARLIGCDAPGVRSHAHLWRTQSCPAFSSQRKFYLSQ